MSYVRRVLSVAWSLVRREVPKFMVVPLWMGRSTYCVNRDAGVYWVIPINWIARWSLTLYLRMRFPQGLSYADRVYGTAYERGYGRGYLKGYDEGRESARAQMGTLVDQGLKDVLGAERYARIVGKTFEEAAHGSSGDTTIGQGLAPTGDAPEASGGRPGWE